MKSILLSLFLLVTLFAFISAESTDEEYDCASCLMPCRLSTDTPRASLTKLFSISVDSYTVTTILDGHSGNFEILVSRNSTNNRIYSARIYVKYWLLRSLCRVLSETPVISHFANDTSRISVQFPLFMRVEAHLQSREEYLTSMFFERVGSLQNDLSATNKQLTALSEEFEQIIVMQPKLKYAIYNATITGDTWWCQTPNPMKDPTGDRFCIVTGGNWAYFELQDTVIFNIILFRLYDQDDRVYTYDLSISPDRINWVSLASGKEGKSLQEIRLDEPKKVKYIKIEGSSTSNDHLHLCSFSVDWI